MVDEVAVSGHESHLVGLRHTARLEVFGGKLSSGGCQPSEVFVVYEVAVSGHESHSVGLRHTARHQSRPLFARRTFTDYACEMPPETSCRLGSLKRLTREFCCASKL